MGVLFGFLLNSTHYRILGTLTEAIVVSLGRYYGTRIQGDRNGLSPSLDNLETSRVSGKSLKALQNKCYNPIDKNEAPQLR